MQDTLLVIDSGTGIVALRENTDGCSDGWIRSVIVDNADLNHGIVINGTFIYASTVSNVYRYTWDPNTQKVTGNETLVTGMDLAESALYSHLLSFTRRLYVYCSRPQDAYSGAVWPTPYG
jgi:hypothetical protein